MAAQTQRPKQRKYNLKLYSFFLQKQRYNSAGIYIDNEEKMKKGLAILFALFVTLSAQDESDPMDLCDDNYAKCMEKCDLQENVSADCYDACDSVYQKCLDKANGYMAEPAQAEESSAPAEPSE